MPPTSAQVSDPSRLDLTADAAPASMALPRTASELSSIFLGGLLFVVIGLALEWSLGYLVLAALGFSISTWLARSLSRALICTFGALGLVAALMVLVGSIDGTLTETLGIGWGVLFVFWWIVAVLCAGAFRLGGVDEDFGLAEIVGCAASIVIAAIVAVKINFDSDLLFYLIHLEDNAAWVGLATQNEAAQSISQQFVNSTLGPVIPELLGILGAAQKPSIPNVNAVFAAYTVPIVLCPLITAALLRKLSDRPRVAIIAFAAIVFAWAYMVPALLFRDFGHLSAIWVFLTLLLAASFFAFDRKDLWAVPAGLGLLLLLGGLWFPTAPLAAALAAALCIISVRLRGNVARALMLVLLVMAGLAICLQLYHSGIAIGTGLQALSDSIKGLYLSEGGAPEIGPLVTLLALSGTVGLAFLTTRIGKPGANLFWFLIAALAYVLAVYAGSNLLGVGADSYGVKKLTFLLVFATTMILIATTARLQLSGKPLVAIVVSLSIASFVFGGAGMLLIRSWPGVGEYPSWLPAIEKVANGQAASAPRPIVCFGDQNAMLSYKCTRWAGALTKAGDGAFLDYRLSVVNAGTETGATVIGLRRSGVLAGSDIIFLERPSKASWWGNVMLKYGGRVFGPDGEPLKKRSEKLLPVAVVAP